MAASAGIDECGHPIKMHLDCTYMYMYYISNIARLFSILLEWSWVPFRGCEDNGTALLNICQHGSGIHHVTRLASPSPSV